MNQVFSLNRWLLLVAKHWSENRKKYLLALVAMAGLLLLWNAFVILVERAQPLGVFEQGATYYVGLFLIGCYFGSTLFSDLSGGPKAIHFLSVPASALEKLLTALLFGVLLFFMCYTLIFYVVDIPMIKIANGIAADIWKESGQAFTPREIVNVFHLTESDGIDPYKVMLLIFFPVQSAFILGSVYFSKYSFIKTAISLLIVFLATLFLVANVLHEIMPRGTYMDNMLSFRAMQDGEWRAVALPAWITWIILTLFKYAFTPIMWVTTWFRLKEKEI